MTSHLDLTDSQFEQTFQTCTLNPELFTHEAHLRLAWIHVKKYGVEKAIENVNVQLLQFVDHVSARDKFNKTVTVAAISAVNHFINKSKSDSFVDFIQEFPRLKNNFKELLAFHYGHDIFKSEIAKREYVEPDLLPFS
jgi:hypothetical protein